MATPLENKSSVDEIRRRFDGDVERFSSLETGQQSTLDAPIVLALLGQAATHWLRPGSSTLDLGCGAGNYSIKLLQAVNPLDCTLVDLSEPMLNRAKARVSALNQGKTRVVQADMRDVGFPDGQFDLIVSGAALHHLRDHDEWNGMFSKMARWLRPGGRLFVSDLVASDDPCLQAILWNHYGKHLESLGGAEYKQKVFEYVEREDSPRSLPFQFSLLQAHGFEMPDVVHRNAVFATYVALKASGEGRATNGLAPMR